jgi:hypothetical protein
MQPPVFYIVLFTLQLVTRLVFFVGVGRIHMNLGVSLLNNPITIFFWPPQCVLYDYDNFDAMLVRIYYVVSRRKICTRTNVVKDYTAK